MDSNSVWYVCKYCRRVYQHKHQLIEHKKINHYELLMRDVNERKLAKKKQKEEEEAKKIAEAEDCRANDDSGKAQVAAGDSVDHAVPSVDTEEQETLTERSDSGGANRCETGQPTFSGSSTSGNMESQVEGAGMDRGLEDLYCNELNCDGGSDSEIEIMFDSHRPLASPMKPLSPTSPSDDATPTKKRRQNEPELDDIIDVEKFESPLSLIEKLEESGNHVYCKSCYKFFLRRSSLRSHRKICHLNESRDMDNFHGKFHIEMRQVETEVGQVKCLSSEHVLVKVPSIVKSTPGRSDCRLYLRQTRNIRTLEALSKKTFYRDHTRGKQFTCTVCRSCDSIKKFKNKKEYLQHVRMQHAPKAQTASSSNQRSGWGQYPGGDAIICKLCGQIYPEIVSLTRHLRNHSFPISSSDSSY